MQRQPTTLTAPERALLAQWHDRVTRYRAGEPGAMPDGVHALNHLKVMGASGDQSVVFPRVQRAALVAMPDDVQFAVAVVERTVDAHRRVGAGRMIFVTARDGAPLDEPHSCEAAYRIDPLHDTEIMVVAPIAGG